MYTCTHACGWAHINFPSELELSKFMRTRWTYWKLTFGSLSQCLAGCLPGWLSVCPFDQFAFGVDFTPVASLSLCVVVVVGILCKRQFATIYGHRKLATNFQRRICNFRNFAQSKWKLCKNNEVQREWELIYAMQITDISLSECIRHSLVHFTNEQTST